MNLVVGATGMVGMETCRRLVADGKAVKALVRNTADPAKVAALKSLGVTIAAGDLRDPASLSGACADATAVVTTASAMPFAYDPAANSIQTTDRDGSLNLINIARAAGVRQFVYTSFPPLPASFPLQDAKRIVERELRESGLRYTILQPTYFMEVWLSPAVGFDYPHRKATIYGVGQNAISWISFVDVARFAAASVDNPRAQDATFELGGPRGIRPIDVVKMFEAISGLTFDVASVPVEALEQQLADAVDPMQKSFAGLMLSYASHQAIDMAATLRTFPLTLRTVEEYAASVMRPAGVG
jgi:NADH dehydrogenase